MSGPTTVVYPGAAPIDLLHVEAVNEPTYVQPLSDSGTHATQALLPAHALLLARWEVNHRLAVW